jgi:hypothetical protein
MTEKRREMMISRIMAHDICAVLDDAEQGDLGTIVSILDGEWGAPGAFTDAELEAEWREGDYGGDIKREKVTSSPTYERFEYVRKLWDKGSR